MTIPIPVNDHRSVLSNVQYEWPQRTLKNPDRSPLLAAAACIRGLIDTIKYLLDELILWVATFLEKLDAALTEHFGPRWWEQFDLKPDEHIGISDPDANPVSCPRISRATGESEEMVASED